MSSNFHRKNDLKTLIRASVSSDMAPQRGSAKHCVSIGGADRVRSTTHAPTVGSYMALDCAWDVYDACAQSGRVWGCRLLLAVASL